jgi:uncharacterized Zn-finger protein
MDQKLILGGMNQRLIEAGKNNNFYCNNCKNEFDHVISFFPMPGLTEYYTCKFCNSIMPVKDLKVKKQKWKYFISLCYCCF